jgi:uncharacterized protein (DUF2235 family)
MATLFVCLDGTGQTKTQVHPTNVARIFDSLGGVVVDGGNESWETTAAVPSPLFGKYLPGVGTQGDSVLRVLGNAFGDGIAEPIVRGYTFLSRNYSAGDDIVITGFSRGATAARALAGFVAVHGLLDKSRYNIDAKDDAYLRAISAWYAYRSDKPDFTNQARLALMALRLGRPIPSLTAADYVPVPSLKAVGVFDTVSSLGLPHLDSNGDAVFDFTICDTALNPKIANGFHALAADETRDLFSPTFWAERDGVVQVICPGVHSNVGGGYPERGLSDGALDWMLGMFNSVGVTCDRTKISPPIAANPLDIARDDAVTFPFKDTPRRARAFPTSAALHASVLARWGQQTEVLPGDGPKSYKSIGTYADGRPIH